MAKSSSALLILGNQLFELPADLRRSKIPVFMAEDYELCTHFKYHKHKIILFLASMRNYAEGLRKNGHSVSYIPLIETTRSESFEEKLERFVDQNKIKNIIVHEIEDLFFEKRILDFAKNKNIGLEILPSPMFMTSREAFANYLNGASRPFMKTFYESQRKKFKVLIDSNEKPTGGRWSFDTENRRKLPQSLQPPKLSSPSTNTVTQAVINLVEKEFTDHPGLSNSFWLPTTRADALIWLKKFIDERLESFGSYEDSLSTHSDFVFHSALSPLINLGLLTPQEVINAAIKKAPAIDLASLEGFVRQVLGWREFVRGIYRHFDSKQQSENFWNHQRKLKTCWYSATTKVPLLDHVLKKTLRYGYNHHIERLMVISNVMLLCEVHPQEVYRWFMEMYVDSSDWVMGPNVFGMGQFSDGGIFATKPYICGSNYWLKMSNEKKGPWCDEIDGLFWSFIKKHKSFFSKNPRLQTMVIALNKIHSERLHKLETAASEIKSRITNEK